MLGPIRGKFNNVNIGTKPLLGLNLIGVSPKIPRWRFVKD